ncbi:hypothetical protein ANO11243_010760 [Dothideomycetidae sp. 11243]|nr:hypothetical protein ANO11243_010760 [fungal sp. No.11243]
MEQTKALNALAPFLALAKSASAPRQAADIVTQATSAQSTYVFAELLQSPAMQSLREDAQYAGHYRLLEIFTWGTMADYEANSSSLPALSDAQSHKIRLLSLLTLASTGSDLSYANLTQALRLPSSKALEDLVTAAIYADLVRATLNPAAETVVISSVAPLRDPAPGSVAAMLANLQAWSARCDSALGDIDARIASVRAEAHRRNEREQRIEKQVWRAEDKWKDAGKEIDHGVVGPRSGRARGDDNAMDLDFDGAGHGPMQHHSQKRKGPGGWEGDGHVSKSKRSLGHEHFARTAAVHDHLAQRSPWHPSYFRDPNSDSIYVQIPSNIGSMASVISLYLASSLETLYGCLKDSTEPSPGLSSHDVDTAQRELVEIEQSPRPMTVRRDRGD